MCNSTTFTLRHTQILLSGILWHFRPPSRHLLLNTHDTNMEFLQLSGPLLDIFLFFSKTKIFHSHPCNWSSVVFHTQVTESIDYLIVFCTQVTESVIHYLLFFPHSWLNRLSSNNFLHTGEWISWSLITMYLFTTPRWLNQFIIYFLHTGEWINWPLFVNFPHSWLNQLIFIFFFFVLRCPAISLGFTTFGWDFCVCDHFLIQPLR